MPGRPAPRARRWHATIIMSLFLVAVAGAAAIGWWYARESPPHHGPIVVISVDGVPASALPAYGAPGTATPAIDALTAESVMFERAYAHSPQMLPAQASLLTGQLPLEHGVRHDAGFALTDEARTLAEMLRNRGFVTGAAVSSFLLRRESGVAQGFSFFDGELPVTGSTDVAGVASADTPPAVERDGTATVAAAEKWLRGRSGQRFFLFVQVDAATADASLARISELLKERGLYDDATIVLVGNRGDAIGGFSLDETALRVPLIVKQPDSAGAGRRIADPVQHIDIVPTILDLVRAPLPGGLRGRSLRAVLDDDDATTAAQPIYAEALAPYFRFGGVPMFGMGDERFRYVRGVDEELIPLTPGTDESVAGAAAESGRLRAALERLLGDTPLPAAAPMAAADEERFALFGYLQTPAFAAPDSSSEVPLRTLTADAQRALGDTHRAAAVLIGQKKYSAGIRALQAIARDHPAMPAIHYQLGMVLTRTGRLDEAIAAFEAARELRPDAPEPTLALADALMRAGRTPAAREHAAEAIALAEKRTPADVAAAHEMAARVALAADDTEAAASHAQAAQAADNRRPVTDFVRGRLLYGEGRYEEAAAAFGQAAATLREHNATLADLHLYYGESLARQDKYVEAEAEFRQELAAFPRNIQAYASLAMLYRASNRDDDVEDVLNELVASTPTPEGYATAARLWTVLGERSRAEALRTDARTRFRGDPSLALLGRDARR